MADCSGGLPAVCAGGSIWAVWMGSLSRDVGSGMAVTLRKYKVEELVLLCYRCKTRDQINTCHL